ncbi:MAG: glutamate--cysteine ligase [Acetobacteraceae bacterium]|nr:glutamate--cysteine ligase [Acetobacteraceae bacterium]MBV8592578.1 glutamate--cysteine ligase [Acetobacteraceae bacterium]
MSNPGDIDATPITSVQQLADYIALGCKPAAAFRIGTEHEKFGFRQADLAPPPYAADDHAAIRDVLEALCDQGAKPIIEAGNIIGLRQGRASISLEPGGQLELSGAPVETVHETAAELEAHFAQVRQTGERLGVGFVPLGFHPTAPRASMPWMPKGRYAIMGRYMPRVGQLGLDMMTRTCTVQVNLDYGSEEDMRRKLRVSLALQPLATALFANSPFTEGRPNGYLSYRAHIWSDTDPDRSGMPAVFFEEGFGFRRYAEWLIDDVPMYFVHRADQYIDVAGRSFRAFMAGNVPELRGITATLGDFADHMTTAFTDVRVKRFLEMRGADAGSPAMMAALPAFWTGLLYDEAALEAAYRLVGRWSRADCLALREAVPKQGLESRSPAGRLLDLARDALAIARDGLQSRAATKAGSADEALYLEPLDAIARGLPVQAEHWLQSYYGRWDGDVNRIFAEAAI